MSVSSSLLSQLSTDGSDVTLWFRFTPPGAPPAASKVTSAKMKLFFRTGNPKLYGSAGAVLWAPLSTTNGTVVLDESNTARRFPLAGVTDVRCYKQSAVFRSSACEAIQNELCFSLASSQYELNLQFHSSATRELWFKVILHALEQTGRRLQDQPDAMPAPAAPTSAAAAAAAAASPSSNSSNPSPAPPTQKKLALSHTPDELARILTNGSPFRKFDLLDSGRVQVQDVICFTSGVGRAGLLHWVPSGSPLVPTSSNSLPLGKITDILMRKKGSVFKVPDSVVSNAKDECCFALVTDGYTLSLEAPTKDQRTAWQDGLIAMLTSAGKQLQPKTSSSSSSSSSNSAAASNDSHSSSSSHRRSPNSLDLTAMHAIMGMPEAQSLFQGSMFYLYTQQPITNLVQRQSVLIFFQGVAEPISDAPGFLYYTTNPADRTLHPSQRIGLSTITEMSGSNKAPTFRIGAGLQASNEHAITITTTQGVWNLEIQSDGTGSNSNKKSLKELRDGFLKNLHTVLMKWRSILQAASTSTSASASSSNSNTPSLSSASSSSSSSRGSISAGGVTPPPSSSSNPSPPPSAHVAEELRMLREGQIFTRHTLSASHPGQLDSRPILVWFDDSPQTSTGPGMLWFVPAGSPKLPTPDGRFPLGSVQTMAAGKESQVFKHGASRAIAQERALSVVSANLVLDLEGPSNEVRERWIKALHGVMVRHGRRATEQRAAAASAANAGSAANTPMSPQRSSPANGGPTTHVVPLHKTADDQLNFLQAGIPVQVFYTTPAGATLVAEIQLFIVLPTISTPPVVSGPNSTVTLDQFNLPASNIHWCAAHHRKVIDGQKLPLIAIRELKEGSIVKDSPVMRHEAASTISSNRCFQIVGTQLTLTLASHTSEEKERFLHALTTLIKLVRTTRPRAPSANQTPTTPNTNNAPANNAKMNPTRDTGIDSTVLIGGVGVGPTSSPSSSLTSPLPPQQEFATMVATPAAANSKPIESPTPVAVSNPQISPMPASPTDSIQSPGPSPSPVPSPTSSTPQSVSSSSSKVAGAPSSASAAAPSSSSAPITDHKVAVGLLQAGQTFTMYSLHSDAARNILNEERSESVIIYFTPSNSFDSPGTLHWYPSTELVRPAKDRSRTFFLNQIKQMRAGKETPILKGRLALDSNPNGCFSLFSINTIWNLEAPTTEIREAWMKALHQVLIRHGLKASDEKKVTAQATPTVATAAATGAPTPTPPTNANAATPTPVAAQAKSSSNDGSQSLSSSTRALPSSNSSLHNRTINFSDPTDFFLLQSKIGEGSYGAVYKALDYRDNSPVAIKVLQFHGRDSLKLRKEIHILKQCHSPYIVGYKGAFQKSSNVWIAMEYCAGGSLTDIMQIVQRTFSEAQVALIMKHALHGLEYLHKQKKIHRDIKGGNLLVSQEGTVKLADFGVSSNLDKTLGKNRTVIGTPHYMAPEVLCNDDYDEKADIWSLAITAYELAIGEPPHAKLHSMRAAIKIPTSPPPTLPEPQRFSSDFHSFLAAALVKDFHTRPSAEELLQHPFILKAPHHSILADNIRAAMLELESRHESMDEIHGLMGSASNGSSKGGKISMRGGSSTRGGGIGGSASVSSSSTLDHLDPSDFDNEIDFGAGSSDTMRAVGSDTMLLAGGTLLAKPLATKTIDTGSTTIMSTTNPADSGTLQFSGTMVVSGGGAGQLSDTIVAAASERSGIGSVPRSPPPALAIIEAPPTPGIEQQQQQQQSANTDDGDEGGLDQFDDEDEDENEVPSVPHFHA